MIEAPTLGGAMRHASRIVDENGAYWTLDYAPHSVTVFDRNDQPLKIPRDGLTIEVSWFADLGEFEFETGETYSSATEASARVEKLIEEFDSQQEDG